MVKQDKVREKKMEVNDKTVSCTKKKLIENKRDISELFAHVEMAEEQCDLEYIDEIDKESRQMSEQSGGEINISELREIIGESRRTVARDIESAGETYGITQELIDSGINVHDAENEAYDMVEAIILSK